MRRLRRFAIGAGIALVLCVLAWFCLSAWFESDFEAEVDRLRADGVRVDLAQFNHPGGLEPDYPAILFLEAKQWREDNGADVCSAAYYLDIPGMFEDDEEGIAEEWKSIEGWIDKHEPFFDKVEEALSHGYANFGVDHREAWNCVVESIPISRAIAEMYEWRVRLAEHQGKPARASVGDCLTVLEFARRVDRGFVITYLVAATVDGVACDMLKRVAGMDGFDPEGPLSALDVALLKAEDESAMWGANDGERASLIHGIRRLATWDGAREIGALISVDDASLTFQLSMTAVRPWVWRDGVAALKSWERSGAIMRKGGPNALAALDALALEWLGGGGGVPPIWQMTSALYFKFPYHLYRGRLKHLAKLRVARAGLLCLGSRKLTGTWPDRSPGVVDPFTGKPFELVREGASLRIEAAVPWLDEYEEGEFREDERIYWTLK